MKRIVTILFGVIFVTLLSVAGMYLWKNFRGALPTIKPSSKDIEKLIEKPIENRDHQAQNNTDMPIAIPPGFSFSIFANNLANPRVLAIDPSGNLLVSIPSQGRVVILPDLNQDGLVDETLPLIDGLDRPHGIAFRCKERCQLYVAETDKVVVYDYDKDNLKVSGAKKIIDLPGGGRHFTRTLLYDLGQDKLFITVGSSCDTCVESDWRRTKVLAADQDGKNLKAYGSGLRNAVFITSHPTTRDIWVTEMGRDFLGDELPPDEINIIREGKDYGWPYCYGKNIVDRSFDADHSCEKSEPSHIDIPAHSAPLGLAFFPEKGWPPELRQDLLVSYHGSWNRTQPTGYKIVRYKLGTGGEYEGEEDFISGWLEGGEALGRPVDILITDKGTIYISDDKAGLVYKMEYLK